MRCFFGAALLGFVAIAMPARADFQVTPTLLSVEPGRIATFPARSATVPRPAGSFVAPDAQGFGRQVPLAFATRQIIPAGVKATFGREVDQSALVDWTGGRPWIDVLRAAVHPVGLHVKVRWMAISITSG